ncbi:hypothetical protein PENCOP_c002G05123 [Penicillium coprophilum]|uniref:Uncharacterized protein n=1 Tax=Penicillium coprophilum TaxID=36646 RepID=A0A1V6V202_9EURO|nr:hypothetical protein PENCOP_c002G05123 [Penicillium coprophilum]
MKTLLTAAGKGGAAMLHFLHSYGVKACPGEFEAQTAMRSAVVRGDSVTTEYLLNQGFDPNPTADELMVLPCGGRFECDEDSPLESYLVDAAQAASSEAAAATLDILLRYGADIGRLEKPPWCWSSSAPTLFYYPERQLVCLHLLLERGASPLPETKFGASMLTEVAEKYRREAIHLLLSHVEKRDISLDDLYRNLLLVKKLSKKWMEENIQGSWYIVKLWRRLYWRKRYPVPT